MFGGSNLCIENIYVGKDSDAYFTFLKNIGGSQILRLLVASIPLIKSKLTWISGNGKKINI